MASSRPVNRQAWKRAELIRSSIQPLLPPREHLVLGYVVSASFVEIAPKNPIQQTLGVRLKSGARMQVRERFVWDVDQLVLVDYHYALLLAADPDSWIVRYEMHSSMQAAPEWAKRHHLHANFQHTPAPNVLNDVHFPSLVEIHEQEPLKMRDGLSAENERKRAVVLELFSWLSEEISRILP